MNQNLKKAAVRIAGMLGIGRITSQKDSGEIQQAQYQTPLEVASAPRMADFGFSSGLPVGTDVVIAFIGGDRSSPVIIASNHQGYRRTGLNEGETAIYNKWAMEVLLTENGVFIDAKGKDVEVNNAANVIINASEGILANTPVLKCTGDIIDNCESTLGLPNDCSIGEIGGISDRQRSVVSKLISTGGLNRDYYIRVAAALGYTITITQFRPAISGMSVCGDALNGDEWPFAWRINAPETTIKYALSGASYCGDPLASWGNKQLECAINKIAPSHLNLIFSYS